MGNDPARETDWKRAVKADVIRPESLRVSSAPSRRTS
jgi:hypothetical protein